MNEVTAGVQTAQGAREKGETRRRGVLYKRPNRKNTEHRGCSAYRKREEGSRKGEGSRYASLRTHAHMQTHTNAEVPQRTSKEKKPRWL